MSLIKVTNEAGVRLEIAAAHVVSIADQGEGLPTIICVSTGEAIKVKESGRSVRGYVKKALASEVAE